jgi:transcriptional regulator with XRE-family HTH domain
MATPTVAEMIAAIRGRGLSTEEIAAAVGASGQAVASWETGRVKKPRPVTLAQLVSLYRSVVDPASAATGARSEPLS